VWRRKIYPQYKEHRIKCKEGVGPFIKVLNERYHKYFKHTIRVDGCEADDIIFTLVQLFNAINSNVEIYIISNDSDYEQIAIDYKIHLINPNKFVEIEIKEPIKYLKNKIRKGDKCDGIPAAKGIASKIRLNRQLIDLTYMPRKYQDDIIKNLVGSNILKYEDVPSNFRPESIQLGLCCMNTILCGENPKIFCSRKPILATVKKEGIKYLKQKALENCADLERMLHWNAKNGIRVMRISSDLFPHISNVKVKSKQRQEKNPRSLAYSLNFAKKVLAKIGRVARLYKIRLTFHPSQFNNLGTMNPSVLTNTIIDLRYQARVLDMLGVDQNGVMVIHGGGLYDSKSASIDRWIENYRVLPKTVKRRLVLENDERYFSIEDCLNVSKIINIPIVFDTHHYAIYNILHPDEKFKYPEQYIESILDTWKMKNIKPKFHVSQQLEKARLGAHSDFIEKIPDYLLNIPKKYNVDIDIMIEAKMKEQAIYHLYELYPEINPLI
jgi:UV DNA damage endonuclease